MKQPGEMKYQPIRDSFTMEMAFDGPAKLDPRINEVLVHSRMNRKRRRRRLESILGTKQWPIILLEAPTPAHLIEMNGDSYILSQNKTLYPCAELARVVKLWTGAPVFREHVVNRTGSRLVKSDTRVGTIKSVWWNPNQHRVEGILVPTEFWRSRFIEARKNGRLDQYGFSITVRYKPHRLKKVKVNVVTRLSRVTGIDLVSDPACGGRFTEARPSKARINQLDRQLEAVFDEE